MAPPPRSKAKALACASPRPSRRTSHVAFAADPPEPDDPLLHFAPYVHRAARRNSITPARQRAFIAALAATGIVTQAARSIGASLEALYRLRAMPGAEGFAAAWEAAIDRGIARLEDCALELALQGEELPIVSAGKLLGTYRKHNFGHIRFMLSQRRALRYGRASSADPAEALLDPAHPAHARLRERWEAEYEARRRAARDQQAARDEAFLHALNRQLGVLRQKAIDAGAIELGQDGRGRWTDPALDPPEEEADENHAKP